jgi:hypothetical protein
LRLHLSRWRTSIRAPGATWLRGVDVSWLVGLFAAGGAYFLLTRSLDRSKEALAIESSEQVLHCGHLKTKEIAP